MLTNHDAAGCRFCQAPLTRTFVDLGLSPLCQSHLDASELNGAEEFYPLHVFVCERCLLVQLRQYVSPEKIFSEYAYFSSFVDTLVREAERYVSAGIPRFGLGPSSKQGKFLPGTHIPILAPDRICETRPDYPFIAPWNLVDEIVGQTSCIRDWRGQWVVPIPEVKGLS